MPEFEDHTPLQEQGREEYNSEKPNNVLLQESEGVNDFEESGHVPLQEQNSEKQAERMEVLEKFKVILGKEPEYHYHDGSAGVSNREDIVELVWTGEVNKKIEGLKLEQVGEYSSNYAYNQTRNYVAEPSVVQIAKIVAEKGRPAKIGYTRIDIDDWVGQEDRAVSERQSAEFDFSEVEAEVLEAARSLAPEYTEMSIEEIGNDLREKEAQERHKEVVERFKAILNKKPEYNSHDGSLGYSRSEDEVVLVFEGKEGKKETIRLDQEGQSGSDYAHSETQYYEANPTAQQLAKIIAARGTPKSVIYTRIDINDWPGSPYENNQISGAMNFSEVEAEVLEAARSLYSEMSLEEIGNAFREKEALK